MSDNNKKEEFQERVYLKVQDILKERSQELYGQEAVLADKSRAREKSEDFRLGGVFEYNVDTIQIPVMAKNSTVMGMPPVLGSVVFKDTQRLSLITGYSREYELTFYSKKIFRKKPLLSVNNVYLSPLRASPSEIETLTSLNGYDFG